MTRVDGCAMETYRPAASRSLAPTRAVIFDGDDTLWLTQWLYDQAEQETRLIVESTGLDGDRWQEICKERDLANVARFGFNSGRFPTSVVAAYAQLCEESGVPVRLDAVRDLMQAASSMFRRKAPVVGGAVNVLTELRPEYQLVLLTKGDPAVQRKRIRDSGLERFFDAIVIVPDKNTDVFRTICAEINADPAKSWSVGNSLPSDIAPALSAGMRGVLVDANSWDYEKRDPGQLAGKFERIARLRELPALLARIVDGPMRRHFPGAEGIA